MKKTFALALAAAGLMVAMAPAHADPRARFMAANCSYCHGTDGKTQGYIPGIAGLDVAYFVEQMKNFRTGERPGTVMKKHAAGYTDAEYEAMAKYFANIK